MTEQEWRDEFAYRMRRAFRARGIYFQSEWAEAIGVSRNTINRYMNGKCAPDAYTIFKIAEVLDWPISDLMVEDKYIHEEI